MRRKKLLWCDAEANCRKLSTPEGVRDVVDKAVRADIDTLIVDVKPLSGEVLYTNRLAPRLGEVDGFIYPESFDLLAAFIEEGHARGLRIDAAVNVFSEGHRQWGRGPAYEHPEWQATLYEVNRTLTLGTESVDIDFVNPWELPDVPVVYTTKSGKIIDPQPDRQIIVIEGDSVSDVLDGSIEEIIIPDDGCVVSLPRHHALEKVCPGEKAVWQTSPVYRLAADSAAPSWGVFVNPIGPARAHELSIIEEIVRGYDIDAIVFDRMRYPNLYADFGEQSRDAFELWLGEKVERCPEDIFKIDDAPWRPPVQGKYYTRWLEWRAWQIKGFAEEASGLARSIRPGVDVGVYVGSWYESYYDVGVNWGSSSVHAGCSWMTPGYNRTGYAELFDYICTGCYYPSPTRADARDVGAPEGASVEAACEISCEAIENAATVYGSIYLRDYRGRPDDFMRAVETALSLSDGVMLFDLVYLEDYGWWPLLGS